MSNDKKRTPRIINHSVSNKEWNDLLKIAKKNGFNTRGPYASRVLREHVEAELGKKSIKTRKRKYRVNLQEVKDSRLKFNVSTEQREAFRKKIKDEDLGSGDGVLFGLLKEFMKW